MCFFFCILRGPRRVSKVKDGERAGAAEVQRGTRAFRRHGGVGERASESWKGERREREREPGSGGGLGESRTKASGQGSRDRAPLAPSEGVDGDSLWSWGVGWSKFKRRWYLLESERFGEEHEGKYDRHGLSPRGYCTQKTPTEQMRKQKVNRRDFL